MVLQTLTMQRTATINRVNVRTQSSPGSSPWLAKIHEMVIECLGEVADRLLIYTGET
jgi:hypothetical protein